MSTNNKEPSQEPVPSDNPEPMEEDATEVIPPPQEASAPQAGPSVGRMIFQKIFGDKHSERKIPATFAERLEDLENREIYGIGLSPADEYVEFLLMDLITGKKNYVHTLQRGQQRWYNDSTLKALVPVCSSISNYEIGAAIRQLRNIKLKPEKLSKLANELENRLISLNLILVSRCYTSLKPDYLSQLLEINVSDDFQKILSGCEWPVVDGRVQIAFNDALLKYIFGKLINPEMGPFELLQKYLPSAKNETKDSLDKIKDLMSISDQMMKVTLPPSASKDESKEDKQETSENFSNLQ